MEPDNINGPPDSTSYVEYNKDLHPLSDMPPFPPCRLKPEPSFSSSLSRRATTPIWQRSYAYSSARGRIRLSLHSLSIGEKKKQLYGLHAAVVSGGDDGVGTMHEPAPLLAPMNQGGQNRKPAGAASKTLKYVRRWPLCQGAVPS